MRELVYTNGTVIRERDEMLSLTDMWRASDSPEPKRPTDWLALTSTSDFRSAVEATFNAGKSGIETKRGGRAPGTWAHWQIAFAYAKYLSPEFHMWCNTVVRAHIEGLRQADTPLPPPDFLSNAFTRNDARELCEWLRREGERQFRHQQAEFSATLKAITDELWYGVGHLKKNLLSPDVLSKRGLVLLPAPTSETTFKTTTEVCWGALDDGDAVHPRLPSIVGQWLISAARRGLWRQGQTEKRSLRDREQPTYPLDRVNEWLAHGGRERIRQENARRHHADVSDGQGVINFQSRTSAAARTEG